MTTTQKLKIDLAQKYFDELEPRHRRIFSSSKPDDGLDGGNSYGMVASNSQNALERAKKALDEAIRLRSDGADEDGDAIQDQLNQFVRHITFAESAVRIVEGVQNPYGGWRVWATSVAVVIVVVLVMIAMH